MTIITPTVALELSDIWKSYPGVAALRGASFKAAAGQVHALLGENGAGKSTLMGIAAASILHDSGTIAVGGSPVEHWTPALARESGLAIVYQHPALLPDLTVSENLRLALPQVLREQPGPAKKWMEEQLARIGCTISLSARLDRVNIADRQLIELAKALALQPRILILDEPTAPLGSDMVERMFQRVREAAAQGVAVVYISHRLPEVRQIADHVTVMRDGEVRAISTLAALSDDEILKLIIGRTVSTAFPRKRTLEAGQRPTLTVERLSAQNFSDVSLAVEPGEIVGLAGIAGNGQSDFLRALAGLERASGDVRLVGNDLTLGRAHAVNQAGVAYLSSDRHGEGLEMTLSVRENVALSSLARFASHGVVRPSLEVASVERQREALNIRTASIDTTVSTLSGGNQQKVCLARALESNPSLLLADEPTQGVDAGARIEIYRILRDIAEAGTPILIVSSDNLELEGLCDRIIVFSRGHVIDELRGEKVSEEQIARAIVESTTHRTQAAPQRVSAGS